MHLGIDSPRPIATCAAKGIIGIMLSSTFETEPSVFVEDLSLPNREFAIYAFDFQMRSPAVQRAILFLGHCGHFK